jgi:peroxiredoxin
LPDTSQDDMSDLSLSRRSMLLSLPVLLWGCSGDAVTRMPDLPFTEIDGQARQLGQLQGKVVLINFWATSCSTCVKEMPRLIETHNRFKGQGLETLAVAMSYDPPAYVMQFAESRKLPFRVAMDHDGSLAQAFGDIQLTPTTLVIDKRGQVVKRYIGEPDFAALDDLLARLLAQPTG